MRSYHRVIGIDLGTTSSLVAVYDRYPELTKVLFSPDDCSQISPAAVGLDSNGRLVIGEAARRNLINDPTNTVVEIRREMGEVFRDETLDKFGARGHFRGGDPVHVRFAGEWFTPQEISALILMKMKQIAEAELGEEVRDAVITVPTSFTEKQRRATEESALLAGLYPRQLIPEPTAAAICYGVDRSEPTQKVYLVYDLGGGTFDVSIIAVEEEKIEVIATSGDRRLGGGDFDDLITAWAVEQLRKDGLDVSDLPVKKAIIKYYAEKLKRQLSARSTGTMTLPEVRPEKPPTLELSQAEFVRMIDPLLQKSINFVDEAINKAERDQKIGRDRIDAILLVGGSSKIPRVKERLLDYFQKDEKFVRNDCDADAVVARGAATVALQFDPTPPPFDPSRWSCSRHRIMVKEDEPPCISLVVEESIGISGEDGEFTKVIERGTRYPVSATTGGLTNTEPTEYFEVAIYQGEGRYTSENLLLGHLHLGPMEPKPAGHHRFQITMLLNVDGSLAMKVYHENEGKIYEAKFDQKTGGVGLDAMVPLRNKLLKMYQGGDYCSPGAPPQPRPVGTPTLGCVERLDADRTQFSLVHAGMADGLQNRPIRLRGPCRSCRIFRIRVK